MSQPPPDQNFYHHSHQPHTQLQLPPQFRNPFDLLIDERTAINYNYIRPYIPNQLPKPNDLADALVMRRPRRTRTTFTSSQIAELEQHFVQGRYLTSSRLADLSNKLALGTAQVKIWFKNRRRRHKIQSDQQKDPSVAFSCEGIQLSPTIASNKKEPNRSNTSRNSSTLGGQVNIKTINLGSSGGSTPTTLTPSPTPTNQTALLMENYGDLYNSYYYNNHHHHHNHGVHLPVPNPPHHAVHSHVNTRASFYQPPTAIEPAGVAQYFPPPTTALRQQQQQQIRNQTHQHQHQPHQYHPQQHLQHHYDFQQKPLPGNNNVVVKKDPDYNYNNSYYVRMSTATTEPTQTALAKAADDAMSSNSGVYEPLTPKNDDSPCLYNGGNKVRASALDDEMDGTNATKSLQVLLPNRTQTCKNENPSSSINILEDCNGAFSKYSKMSLDNHETNYQCTMDTLMAYNSYRNPAGSTQFAYCFN